MRAPMGALYDFLQKNQIEKKQALPLVHTTEAYHLKRIAKTGAIIAAPCTVFKGEDLSYFFVGRPAFKKKIDQEAEYWELPICFIVEFNSFRPKRVYPFDSGAFKAGLYPNYLSMMDLAEFEVSSDSECAEKLIGTFFTSSRNYYGLKARPADRFKSQFDVEVLEEEIRALHKIIEEKDSKFDDRRFAIEFQNASNLELNSSNVRAVVIPESYIESGYIVDFIESKLDADIITYPMFPLNKEYYYYAIYEKVESYLRHNGLFHV
jgi:hypothetical protein